MPEKIPQEFFLATVDQPVARGDAIWTQSLPRARQPMPPQIPASNLKAVTYGDYFNAVGEFLENERYRVVKMALADGGEGARDFARAQGIAIFLVKHGAFYHPARVVVKLETGQVSFVVNVAISKTGRDHIKTEFNLLSRLGLQFNRPTLPRVYHLDEIPCRGGQKVLMFNGQWFDGFYEFHITADHPENQSNLVVWGQDDTRFFLTWPQAEDVYRQAARILTSAYQIFSFQQIAAWHHAAGDFILKPVDAAGVELRLITVRKYVPLLDSAEPDLETLVEALLLFLINLTLRNRLDRLDGTGPLAWAQDIALVGTIKGFFKGLMTIVSREDLPETFPADFHDYVKVHPKEVLLELFSGVVERIFGASPERAFVRKHLVNHVDLFYTLLAAERDAIPDQTTTT